MKCTDKEWQHCRVEKMGCPGCYYDEIEPGEYIRNKDGYIDKVKKVIEPDEKMTEKYYCCESTMASSHRSQIIKHSKKILDLIEVGDILAIKEGNDICYLGLAKDTITVNYTEIKKSIENKECELLSILTHEQYQENCFKVGD